MIGRKQSALIQVFGSVLPRTFWWALLGALEGILLDMSHWQLFIYRVGPRGSYTDELWHHPYSVNVFATVIGFALVMRVQIA